MGLRWTHSCCQCSGLKVALFAHGAVDPWQLRFTSKPDSYATTLLTLNRPPRWKAAYSPDIQLRCVFSPPPLSPRWPTQPGDNGTPDVAHRAAQCACLTFT